MVGYLSEALGGATAGFLSSYLTSPEVGWSKIDTTNLFFYVYALFGLLKVFAYWLIDNSKAIEAKVLKEKVMLNFAGIDPKNMKTIVMLSVLFAFDAFGGAFVAKSFISYYFYERYEIVLSSVGMLLFFCNIVSGISGILSAKLVEKIGAMATMIFTHLPSNLFLLAIPFATNSYLAMILLLGRFCISQMDVPARQTYVNFVVSSSERSAANGITNIARSVGLSIGMGINGYFINIYPHNFVFAVPFLIAGGIKIVYDIVLGCCFLWGQRSKRIEQHF